MRVSEVVLGIELVNVASERLHVAVGPVAMAIELVVTYRCIQTSVDEDGGCLRLRLRVKHDNIRLIVIEDILADLHVLPRLEEAGVVFIRSC